MKRLLTLMACVLAAGPALAQQAVTMPRDQLAPRPSAGTSVPAATVAAAPRISGAQRLTLVVGTGRLLVLPEAALTVLAADPRIARVQPASPTSLFLMAVGAGRTTVIALPLDDVDEAVRRLVAVEAAAVLAVLGVLALVMWWVIRLGVRPVQRMTETASAIAAGDLSQRVPEGAPGTEAGDLGVALNGMLGRIEDAFDQRTESEARLRQFVADASHELRTPVATIRGYAELVRRSPDAMPVSAPRRRERSSAWS